MSHVHISTGQDASFNLVSGKGLGAVSQEQAITLSIPASENSLERPQLHTAGYSSTQIALSFSLAQKPREFCILDEAFKGMPTRMLPSTLCVKSDPVSSWQQSSASSIFPSAPIG